MEICPPDFFFFLALDMLFAESFAKPKFKEN
ncbi:hypothetical protein SGRA_2987 [Saprospira grandis str. Lewin]|uniref:Uncharacterized protein n=1 Tax=Saprospira grandis (strain Lewin) TaxID=984262 RepID=H6LAX2_SAPGL|nr:hypothetical protein SGRA_2987 [Saprospira grandis str. Lewin]